MSFQTRFGILYSSNDKKQTLDSGSSPEWQIKKISEEMKFNLNTNKHGMKCHSKLDLESYVHQMTKNKL